ncbi:cytochrome b6-f complex subunit PetG [Pseudomonas putida]|nr:cytochrome b6-f complex subunit PetG [Pseudomonas putida]
MIKIFLFKIILNLIPITLTKLFITTYLQYQQNNQLNL